MIDEEGRLKRIDYGNRVFYDSVTGIAGVIYPIGTSQMPSNTIANAITICGLRNINVIHVTGTLDIGTGIVQTLVGSYATLTGQSAGTAFARDFRSDLIIDAMTGGTITIIMNGGTVTINANCTGGIINIYGSARVTDNSVGTVVNDYTLDQRAANIDTQLDGTLVQVPFFNTTQTVKDGSVTLFALDALGATIREVFVSFYLALDAAATFTPTWHKTRPGDLVTFTQEADPALAQIITPGANRYYSYKLGELAHGLQGELRLAQDNNGNANNVCDAFCVVLMEI